MATRQRQPGRLQVAKARRLARKGEAYISAYEFPAYLGKRTRSKLPQLDDLGWLRVERGLREWFVCCAWRGRTVLGMPSRAVDEAWHEFILDTASYVRFCEGAFGSYLHHTPGEAMTVEMGDALAETVRAWDRSAMGEAGESVLWNLDRELRVPDPLGITESQLISARSRIPYTGGAGVGWLADPGSNGDGGGGGTLGSEHHGAHDAPGCGSGCGGGGCGGGG